MHKQIFINLAVDNLDRSKAFFSALGFSFNEQFTNDRGACLVLGENIYAMLLVKDFFSLFTSKSLCDPKQSTEALLCLSCESRSEVDALVAKAIAAGGTAPRERLQNFAVKRATRVQDCFAAPFLRIELRQRTRHASQRARSFSSHAWSRSVLPCHWTSLRNLLVVIGFTICDLRFTIYERP